MRKSLPIRFTFSLAMISCFLFQSFSQEKKDSAFYKNSVKIDLASLYDVFFDSHFQIRTGMEYERIFSKKHSAAIFLDAGLYDKYDFIKYYNFFGQNQGLYSSHQATSITGFHLLPSYNYYFYSFRKKPNRKIFVSAISDFGYYYKKIISSNTLNSDESADNYSQIKFGMGLGVGYKNYFRKHISYELKTSMFVKLCNYVSENGRNPIRALDAQWTSLNNNFWWISNFKIGYVF